MHYYIVEGVDGCGKTTQMSLLKERLKHDSRYVFIKEPDSASFFKDVKRLVLESSEITQKARFFMFLALRSQIFDSLDLTSQKILIAERSFISNIAYGGLDMEKSLDFNLFAIDNLLPRKIIMLIIDKPTLESRLAGRPLDIIEGRGVEYLLSVQERMLKVIKILKSRYGVESLIIDAGEGVDSINEKIISRI